MLLVCLACRSKYPKHRQPSLQNFKSFSQRQVDLKLTAARETFFSLLNIALGRHTRLQHQLKRWVCFSSPAELWSLLTSASSPHYKFAILSSESKSQSYELVGCFNAFFLSASLLSLLLFCKIEIYLYIPVWLVGLGSHHHAILPTIQTFWSTSQSPIRTRSQAR
jgi:hypothetical protein